MNITIPLVRDTIDREDIEALAIWLQTMPRLTKDHLTLEFEEKWSSWLGSKYSVFVNSGSSANLAVINALMETSRLRNPRIVFSALSWPTTVTPAIQLGLHPILCEADKGTLGISIPHFKRIIRQHRPAAVMPVHVLGFSSSITELRDLCLNENILLIEDTCEAPGTVENGKKLGTFGLAGTFSFYYGHHISTIEGGMISTDDEELYDLMLSIRAHGWDRDLSSAKKKKLRTQYKIDDFRALYTFYYPGYNFRPMDLQAFLGLRQLSKIDNLCSKRFENLVRYDNAIKNPFWKLPLIDGRFVSNFAYPLISPHISEITTDLAKNGIETRPLVAGSIGLQPFWRRLYGKKSFKFADQVHKLGFYIPNNPDLTLQEIEKISEIINKHTK